jgi:hypothetical protein
LLANAFRDRHGLSLVAGGRADVLINSIDVAIGNAARLRASNANLVEKCPIASRAALWQM